jgi:hypothetical protein
MKLRREFIDFITDCCLPAFLLTAWNNTVPAGWIFMALYLGEIVVLVGGGGVGGGGVDVCDIKFRIDKT